MTAPDESAFGVYVHWPFCLSKCPYCDFNSHVRHAAIDEAALRARLRRRDRRDRGARAAAAPSRAIFFGGGTPSLMQPATVGAILDAIGKHWTVAPDAEVTLEANPTSVEATRFRGYRAAGVNRVSLGVQALDDDALKSLGRTAHRAGGARRGRDRARGVRALFVRPDLCAAGTDAAGLGRRAQARASRKPAEHLSLYQLTIEPDTPFHALHAAGKLIVPDDDTARALYDTTQEVCAAAGLPAYEISNHARPGAECRHNLVYWRAHEYAGIGPGAHGRLDIDGERHATATEKPAGGWLMRVESLGHGVVSDDTLLRSQMARRIPADGAAARRRHRPRALRARSPAARSIRGASQILQQEGAIETDAAAASCASRRRDFRCSTRWWPISRRDRATYVPTRAAERARRRADDLPAGRRHPHHRQAALVDAVAAEAEQAVDAVEAGRVGQHLGR